MVIASFSTWLSTCKTCTRTPTSMFMTVRGASSRKVMSKTPKMKLSCSRSEHLCCDPSGLKHHFGQVGDVVKEAAAIK